MHNPALGPYFTLNACGRTTVQPSQITENTTPVDISRDPSDSVQVSQGPCEAVTRAG